MIAIWRLRNQHSNTMSRRKQMSKYSNQDCIMSCFRMYISLLIHSVVFYIMKF